MKKEIQTLLGKKWESVHDNNIKIEDGHFPGVYFIAWTKNNLSGKSIKLADIFYVGMSNAQAGLSSRINQFKAGIEKGKGHSGGNRFYKEFCGGVPFSKTNHKNKFYIASLTFECNVFKETRTPKDLRIMGKICHIEYLLLAYIKENLGKEPILNKK